MRLFLAIELPSDVRDHLCGVCRRLPQDQGKISLTRPENLHLTLKFLGEVEPNRVEEIRSAIGQVHVPEISLQGEGIECFPTRDPVRIVAARMGGSIAASQALVREIDRRCQDLGFAPEQREYRPHVTLGRGRPALRGKFRHLAEDLTSTLWPGPEFSPEEYVLMSSRIGAQGPTYSTLARFAIGWR